MILTPPTGTPSPTGILVVDKPLGRTSMNICAVVRAKLRRGGAPKGVKVGHGGTLDPLATGVLVILIGKATRLCDLIMQGRKRYLMTIDLAHVSPTHDRESEFSPFLPTSGPLTPPDPDRLAGALDAFLGTINQVPPIHSAINLGGTRAYHLAREGLHVPVRPRPVTIDSITTIEYRWPRLTIDVVCGKGTYMRSLARDIGLALGTGGVLDSLRRTQAAPFQIAQARDFDQLPFQLVQADLDPIPDHLHPGSPPAGSGEI